MQKKATAQIAHLVFADTKANAKKPKEPFFLPTHGRTVRQLFKHFLHCFSWY